MLKEDYDGQRERKRDGKREQTQFKAFPVFSVNLKGDFFHYAHSNQQKCAKIFNNQQACTQAIPLPHTPIKDMRLP